MERIINHHDPTAARHEINSSSFKTQTLNWKHTQLGPNIQHYIEIWLCYWTERKMASLSYVLRKWKHIHVYSWFILHLFWNNLFYTPVIFPQFLVEVRDVAFVIMKVDKLTRQRSVSVMAQYLKIVLRLSNSLNGLSLFLVTSFTCGMYCGLIMRQTWPSEYCRCAVQDSLVLMDSISTFLTLSLRGFPCQKVTLWCSNWSLKVLFETSNF